MCLTYDLTLIPFVLILREKIDSVCNYGIHLLRAVHTKNDMITVKITMSASTLNANVV